MTCLYQVPDGKSSVVIVEGWGNMMLGSFAAYFKTNGKNIFPIHKFITSVES